MITALVLLAACALVLLIRLLIMVNGLPSFAGMLPHIAGGLLVAGRWLLLALAFGYLALIIIYPFYIR
jgi:hypothetical protein